MNKLFLPVILGALCLSAQSVFPPESGPLPSQLSSRTSTGINYVFDGDSLTAGYGLSKSAATSTACKTSISDATCQDWPSQFLLMSSTAGRIASKNNFAVPGNKISDVQGRYTTSVHPLSPAVTNSPAYLFVWMGANDFDFSETPSQMETALAAYWSAAKADGFTLIVGTIMRRGDDVSAADELVRQTVNTWIRAQFQAGAYDYLMDFDALYQNPFDGVLFQADFIHPTAAGAYLEAKYVNGVLWGDSYEFPGTFASAPTPAAGNVRGTWDALRSITTGTNNSAFGDGAAGALTTGSSSAAFGYHSLNVETTGTQNTCYGYLSCTDQSGQSSNTAFGFGALNLNTSGSENTAVGYSACGNGPAPTQNVCVGKNAGINNTGTGLNVIIGFNTWTHTGDTSFKNVIIGARAGASTATGSQAVVIGTDSGVGMTGNNNVVVGQGSGSTGMAGTSNVLIGQAAQVGTTVTGAVQLGTGTNSNSNTLQFQSVKLADSNGYLYSAVSTPASSSATCTTGAIWTDATYVYVCTATNTIKRVALSTF